MAKPRLIDGDGVGRSGVSQDSLGNLARDVNTDIDMEMVQSIGAQAADAFLQNPEAMRSAFATYMGKMAEMGDLTQIEGMRHALQLIDQQSPGLGAQLAAESGAGSLFGDAFGVSEVAAAEGPTRTPRAFDENVPHLEQLGTYGKGLGEKLDISTRSQASRLADIDPATANAWQKRMLLRATSPELYQAGRQQQIRMLMEQGVPEDVARNMTATQRDAAVGPVDLGGISDNFLQAAIQRDMEASGGKYASNEAANLSQRDKLVMSLLDHANRGTTPVMDAAFRGWRYPYPIMQGGELVRPPTAPTGDFLARLVRGQLGAFEVPDWVAKVGPVFDRAIQEQAGTAPATSLVPLSADGWNPNKNNAKALTAADFAKLQLPVSRLGVSRLKAADAQGWPFQVYSDIPLNRGMPDPLNVGQIDAVGQSPLGGLMDAESAAPDAISTPEDMPLPEEQQLLPGDEDMSMYMPRRGAVPPGALAALLA